LRQPGRPAPTPEPEAIRRLRAELEAKSQRLDEKHPYHHSGT
jgi:hypothetical protein